MVVATILFIISLFIAKGRYRSYANPAIMFSFLWMIILFLDSKLFFGLREVSDKAEIIIVQGLVAFMIGSLVAALFDNYDFAITNESRIAKNVHYHFNYTFLYIASLICIVFFLKNGFISLISVLKGASLDAIRTAVQSSTDGNFVNNILTNFVAWPFSYMLEAVAVVDYFFGKKDKKLFRLTLIVIFLRVFGDAGRTPLMDFAIYMLLGIAYLTKKERKNILEQIKKFKYLILGILLLVIATISRSSTTVWRQLYFYFAMPPVLLDQWSEQVSFNGLITYGLTSFNGVLFPILYIVKNLLGLEYPLLFQQSYDVISSTVSNWLPIASGRTVANAYVSMFWYFYTDARMYGVIILSFIYGYCIRRYYNRSLLNRNIRNVSLYFLLYQGLFFSFIRFPFSKAYYVLAIIYTICFAISKSAKGVEEWKLLSSSFITKIIWIQLNALILF